MECSESLLVFWYSNGISPIRRSRKGTPCFIKSDEGGGGKSGEGRKDDLGCSLSRDLQLGAVGWFDLFNDFLCFFNGIVTSRHVLVGEFEFSRVKSLCWLP